MKKIVLEYPILKTKTCLLAQNNITIDYDDIKAHGYDYELRRSYIEISEDRYYISEREYRKIFDQGK